MQQSSQSMAERKPKEQRYLVNTPEKAYQIACLVHGLNTSREWEVIIKPYQKKRSDRQNGLYWIWIGIIADDLGYEKDDLHDILRERFLPVRREVILGIERKRLTSTSSRDFTTQMMAEYMANIERFAAQEFGILLPRSDDDYHRQNMERMGLR